MREAAKAAARRTSDKPPSLMVNEDVRRRLEAHFEDDYRYVKDQLGITL